MDIRGRFSARKTGRLRRPSRRKARAYNNASSSLSDPILYVGRHSHGIPEGSNQIESIPARSAPGISLYGSSPIITAAPGLYPCQIEGVFENARIGFVRPGVFGANDAPEIAVQPAVTQLDLLHSGETVGHDIHRIPLAQLADDFPRIRNQAAERRGELQVIVGQSPGQRRSLRPISSSIRSKRVSRSVSREIFPSR